MLVGLVGRVGRKAAQYDRGERALLASQLHLVLGTPYLRPAHRVGQVDGHKLPPIGRRRRRRHVDRHAGLIAAGCARSCGCCHSVAHLLLVELLVLGHVAALERQRLDDLLVLVEVEELHVLQLLAGVRVRPAHALALLLLHAAARQTRQIALAAAAQAAAAHYCHHALGILFCCWRI